MAGALAVGSVDVVHQGDEVDAILHVLDEHLVPAPVAKPIALLRVVTIQPGGERHRQRVPRTRAVEAPADAVEQSQVFPGQPPVPSVVEQPAPARPPDRAAAEQEVAAPSAMGLDVQLHAGEARLASRGVEFEDPPHPREDRLVIAPAVEAERPDPRVLDRPDGDRVNVDPAGPRVRQEGPQRRLAPCPRIGEEVEPPDVEGPLRQRPSRRSCASASDTPSSSRPFVIPTASSQTYMPSAASVALAASQGRSATERRLKTAPRSQRSPKQVPTRRAAATHAWSGGTIFRSRATFSSETGSQRPPRTATITL